MPRLHAPVVDSMVDNPTVNLDAVNIDCHCLVVIQMHSVLFKFDESYASIEFVTGTHKFASEFTSSGLL